jgi:hypothetical protein
VSEVDSKHAVLKRKWLKKDISIETYLKAVQLLTVDVWGGAIESQDYGLRDPFLCRKTWSKS